MKRKWIFLAPLGLALFLFAGGQVVASLWNWLLPDLFGFHTITGWQALGLLALTRILFGGGGAFRRPGFNRDKFRQKMADRFGKMTPEERERCCPGIRPATEGSSPSTAAPGQPA